MSTNETGSERHEIEVFSGLRPTQRWVLTRIARHGPIRFGALQELTGFSRSGLSRVVTSLSDRGLVERVDAVGEQGTDGRAKYYRLHPDIRRIDEDI